MNIHKGNNASLFYICLELYFISQQMCHDTLYTLGWNLKNILCYFLISACDFYVDHIYPSVLNSGQKHLSELWKQCWLNHSDKHKMDIFQHNLILVVPCLVDLCVAYMQYFS